MRRFSARSLLKDLRAYPLGAMKVMTPRLPSCVPGNSSLPSLRRGLRKTVPEVFLPNKGPTRAVLA